MTAKEQKFVLEYLIDGNASRSYVAAGYSPKNPDGNAYKLLSRPEIAAAIKAEQDKTSKKLEVTREFIVREYLELIDSCKQGGDFGPDRTNLNKTLSQLSKLLGLDAAEVKNINISAEQPLFGTLEDYDNDELLND